MRIGVACNENMYFLVRTLQGLGLQRSLIIYGQFGTIQSL